MTKGGSYIRLFSPLWARCDLRPAHIVTLCRAHRAFGLQDCDGAQSKFADTLSFFAASSDAPEAAPVNIASLCDPLIPCCTRASTPRQLRVCLPL